MAEKHVVSIKETSFVSTREMHFVILGICVIFYIFIFGLVGSIYYAYPKDSEDYYGHVGGHWDHPEPNYTILPFCAEFFAVITAVPFAGLMLAYLGIKYSYGLKVKVLYLMTVWMYSCAFFSHMTLIPLINSITLTSVLSNALYTFLFYSHMAGGFLKSGFMRFLLTVISWGAVVYFVNILPDYFGGSGGVPTLLVVQTPAVFAAMVGAFYMTKKDGSNYPIYKLLATAGFMLITAMAISLVEVLYGVECQEKYFGIVPFFHVTIHTFEQIAIYMYGVGVSAIEHVILKKEGHLEYVDVLGGFVSLPYVRREVVKSVKTE